MAKTKRVFIVPYCHCDWAWTANRRWHEKRYVLVLEEVLGILRERPDFRWLLDGYVTLLELFRRVRPAAYEELKQRVLEGKVQVGGSFTNLRPSMVGEETQIRDLAYGREVLAELFPGADLSVYSGTLDVSVGHPQVPQLLTQFGYSHLRFWRPHDALCAKGIPLEFCWDGLDGSRIVCARGRYDCDAFNSTEGLSEKLEDEVSFEEALSPSGIRWVTQGADDCRPLRTYQDALIPLFEFIDEWNAHTSVPLAFASPTEFFRALKDSGTPLPVVAGTLDPCDVCFNAGWGGSHGLFWFRQKNDAALTDAETWQSLASTLGHPYEQGGLRRLWESHLKTCAHATQWLFEDDFEEMRSIAADVRSESRRIKRAALDAVKGLVATDERTEYVLFNPLPFERDALVKLPFSLLEQTPWFRLMDGRGQEIPFQIRESNEVAHRLWEFETSARVALPALGYTAVSLVRGEPSKREGDDSLSVEFEGSALTRVRAGQIAYTTEADNSFGEVKLYRVDTTKGVLHVGPIVGIEAVLWEDTQMKEDGHLLSRYESRGRIGDHRIARDILVRKDEPVIEFHLKVVWAKEDGFLTLEWPLPFEGTLWGDTPFAVEEKDLSREPFGPLPASRFDNLERQRPGQFFAKSFVSHSDGARSITYFNWDATHYYLRSEASVGNLLLNSITHRPDWERFINRSALAEGTHRFTAYLMFHPGDWRQAHLPRKAQELLGGIERVPVDGAAQGRLGPSGSFLSLSPANLVMTALYREGDWFIVRFYEAAGEPTHAALELPFAPQCVERIDLGGNVLGSLRCGKRIGLDIRPWEIVTLRFS